MTITLNSGQKQAVQMFTEFLFNDEKNMILKGGSGTGKSTTTAAMIDAAKSAGSLVNLLTDTTDNMPNLYLTATTHDAAKNLFLKTGKDSTTVHSLFKIFPKTDYKTGKQRLIKQKGFVPLENSIIVVDEASMENKELYELVNNSTYKCKVLRIGDPYQLPPVGESEAVCFNDIDYGIELTEPMRFLNGSPIHALGDAYKQAVITGKLPKINDYIDGTTIRHCRGDVFENYVNQEFINKPHPDEAMLLAYQNATVRAYLEHIREIQGHSTEIEPGDVLVSNSTYLKSNGKSIEPYLHNGEIVKVRDTTPTFLYDMPGQWVESSESKGFFVPTDFRDVKRLTQQAVDNKDWFRVDTLKNACVDLRNVYAGTVHKAQGKSINRVYINLTDIATVARYNPNLFARLMYVAITRAKHQIFLYGKLPPNFGG